MNTADFLNFRELLKNCLKQFDFVTGLAFVGSAAETSRADEWSDHDFFVFTTKGQAETLRQVQTWLPDHTEIALFVRETEHGLKVIYNNGHVLEFAVFEEDWELSGVNSFDILIDKAATKERLEAARVRSIPMPIDVDREFSLFLANLLIGVGRFRRGENLSARQFINNYCLNSVVRLVTTLCPASPGFENSSDNQNLFRRFELRFPKLAQDLESIQLTDLETGARQLLELVIENLTQPLDQKKQFQISVIKNRLGWF